MIPTKDWKKELRLFKEALAKRLWAIPTVTETEKEMVFKEYLGDLDGLEKSLSEVADVADAREKSAREEIDVLRSLLGVAEDDLKLKLLTVEKEKSELVSRLASADEEVMELRRRVMELTAENEAYRIKQKDIEAEGEHFRVRQLKLREEDVRFFAENHESMKNQLKDLETRLANLRHLFTEANNNYLSDKQQEITLLQKKLLEEMEDVLRKKQDLSWQEEEMFAKGVANRVRTALVSAQGRLMLTLERLGLLDPKSKTEAFWSARLRLLVDGAPELSQNFRAIQAQLQDVTAALDDYLHLTHRREITTGPVSIKELVQAEMGQLFMDPRPTLNIEFLSDDPLPDVPGDLSLLKFTIHELLKNALEALPNETGKITVSLKNVVDRGFVQILIRDSGGGIPDHVVGRLFQPFFTTKNHRQGISLSRAKRYVEYHGGELKLVQTGPQGTVFEVELPVTQNTFPRAKAAIPHRVA